ncbi:hypothetical protein ADG881_1158 [Alcanivorax sp. DG881]|nr:hypothetical protein ADG881_1158 [Alcanivorax sp. DG881]
MPVSTSLSVQRRFNVQRASRGARWREINHAARRASNDRNSHRLDWFG